MKDGDKSGISWVHVEMTGWIVRSKCGCNNMVWVAISNKICFVELGLKPAARTYEQSLVNQCIHKIDFLLHRTKRIPMQVLADKGGLPIHRYDKSSFTLLNWEFNKW